MALFIWAPITFVQIWSIEEHLSFVVQVGLLIRGNNYNQTLFSHSFLYYYSLYPVSQY